MANSNVSIDLRKLGITWQKDSDYTITFDQGFTKESDNNRLPSDTQTNVLNADSSVFIHTFATDPSLVSLNPTNNSTGLSAPTIKLGYDRTIFSNTGTFTLNHISSGTFYTISSTDTRITYSGNKISINLSNNTPRIFQGGEEFYINYTSGTVDDIFNFKAPAVNDNSTIRYTYKASPSITGVTPSYGSSGAFVNSVNVTFDRNITKNVNNIKLYRSGSLVSTIPASSSSVVTSGNGLTIGLTQQDIYEGGEVYHLTLDYDIVTDNNNLPFRGVADDTVIKFTQLTNPETLATIPAMNAANISSPTLRINTNRTLQKGSTGNFKLYSVKPSGEILKLTIPVADARVTTSSTWAIIDLSADDVDSGRIHYLTIDKGTLKDTNNLPFTFDRTNLEFQYMFKANPYPMSITSSENPLNTLSKEVIYTISENIANNKLGLLTLRKNGVTSLSTGSWALQNSAQITVDAGNLMDLVINPINTSTVVQYKFDNNLFDDRGKTSLTLSEQAKLDSSKSKWGGSSLLVGTDRTNTNYARFVTTSNITLSNSFTVEGWIWLENENEGNWGFLQFTGSSILGITSDKKLLYWNGSTASTGNLTIPTEQWVHIGFSKVGSSLYGAVNGQASLISNNVSGTFTITTGVLLGSDQFPNESINGWIDNFRVVNGQALYISTYTVPTEEPFILSPNLEAIWSNASTDNGDLLWANSTKKFTQSLVAGTVTVTASTATNVISSATAFTVTANTNNPAPAVVNLYRGTTQLASITTTTNQAKFSISTIPVGTSTIRAVWNTGFATSATNTCTQIIYDKNTTTLSLSIPPTITPYNQDRTISTSSIAASMPFSFSGFWGSASGSINLYTGSGSLVDSTPVLGKQTHFINIPLPQVSEIGTSRSYQAKYDGDGFNKSSTSTTATVQITKASITTASVTAYTFGNHFTFPVTFTLDLGQARTTTTVAVSKGSTILTSSTQDQSIFGPIEFDSLLFSTGTHVVTFTVPGDDIFETKTTNFTITKNNNYIPTFISGPQSIGYFGGQPYHFSVRQSSVISVKASSSNLAGIPPEFRTGLYTEISTYDSGIQRTLISDNRFSDGSVQYSMTNFTPLSGSIGWSPVIRTINIIFSGNGAFQGGTYPFNVLVTGP